MKNFKEHLRSHIEPIHDDSMMNYLAAKSKIQELIDTNSLIGKKVLISPNSRNMDAGKWCEVVNVEPSTHTENKMIVYYKGKMGIHGMNHDQFIDVK